jgi:hypothetical protein
MKNISEDIINFFYKIFIPSFVAISIKVATQVKKEKMTMTRVVLSFVIGIGCAYFVFPFVNKHIENAYLPLIVGVVSISGEKIAEYVIYKFNVDFFLQALVDAVREMIVKLISK